MKHRYFEMKHAWFEMKHEWFKTKHAWFKRKHAWFERKHAWFETKHEWFEMKHAWLEMKHAWFEMKHAWFKTKHEWFEPQASASSVSHAYLPSLVELPKRWNTIKSLRLCLNPKRHSNWDRRRLGGGGLLPASRWRYSRRADGATL